MASLIAPYRNLYSSTSDVTAGNNYTFAASDVGAAHANRMNVLGVYQTQTISGITVNGVAATSMGASGLFSMWKCALGLAGGITTADIVIGITGGTSLRCACAVFSFPTGDVNELKFDAANASGTGVATIVGMPAQEEGWIVFFGGQTAVAGDYTVTWGGTAAVVESYDTPIEAVTGIVAGYVLPVSNVNKNLALAAGTTGAKNFVASSWRKAA